MRWLLSVAAAFIGCTAVRPEKIAQMPAATKETSGLVCVDDKFFTINDSQNDPVLFQLDTNGLVQRTISINARNNDWEDLCRDGSDILIADVGNNLQTRRDQRVYVVGADAIQNDLVDVDSISFQLPDQPNHIQKRNRNYDIEACFVKDNFIYFISKNAKSCGKSYGKLYRVPKTNGELNAALIDSFQFREPITSADFDDVANRLIVTGYLSCFVFDDFKDSFSQSAPPRRYRYNKLRLYEGLAFSEDKQRVFLSNERGIMRKATLFQIPIERLTTDKRLGGGPGFWWRRMKLTMTLWVYNGRVNKLAKR